MVMKKLLALSVMILPIVVNLACHDNPVGPARGNLHLSAEDVGVTDVWLRVRVTQGDDQRTLSISRDEETVFAAQISTLDTVILSNLLLPRHSYTYTATLTGKNIFATTITALTVTTLDTTSHDFMWQVDTLGDGANSFLKDVAIVNDTCVFAVGEIHIKDSLGNWDPALYNVARWNGLKWSYSVGASVTINAVFALSDTDVWAGTTAPYHFDGATWRGYNVTGLFNGYVTKIWGISSSNMYMVGTNGAIMHFNGSVWQKMESGTDVDLLDVWGSPDGSVVWACGYYSSRAGTFLLRNSGTEWNTVYDGTSAQFTARPDSLSGTYSSVFAPTKERLFVLSDAGLYQTTSYTHGEATRIAFPLTWSGFPWRLRGYNINDLFIVGEHFMVAHFNGIAFKHYESLSGYGRLVSVDQGNDLVVAVGYSFDPINSKGIVLRGRR